MSDRQTGAPPLQLRERRGAREREFARRFRQRPAGVVSLAIVLVVLVAAIIPGVVATHDPIALDGDQRASARRRGSIGSAPTSWAAIPTPASSTLRGPPWSWG